MSERPNVILLTDVPPRVTQDLAGWADTIAIDTLDDLDRPAAQAARMLATTHRRPVDGALLERLPKLEMIASLGAGYETIDVAEAMRRGVVVANTPGAVTEETADLALGLLLMTVRRLGEAERFLRAGRWVEGAFPLAATTLRTARIGILGMGRIGRAIARRLEGFGRPILYHARHAREELPYQWLPSPRALAEAVDVLVAILPGGAGTHHLVDGALLDALGPGGVFVNVGRGSVVDEAALLAALEAGRIAAAGLDVYEDEPQPLPGLIGRADTVLLPHVGSATVVTRDAMADELGANLRNWFEHRRAITPVSG